MSDRFGHIYFDNWVIGNTCLRKVNGKVLNLGVIIAKEAVGRQYDKDIQLTLEKDGKQYTHIMEFDGSYKQIDTINTNNTL